MTNYMMHIPLGNQLNVDFINNFAQQHSDGRVIIEVQNTKNISSSLIKQLNPNVLIRIAGGYDDNRIKYGEFQGNYYLSAVVYTRDETVKILEEIEKIESNIRYNWSDVQKLLYVYDKLKSGVMYDPKYNSKSSSEVRSLRGLITKKTVCAGYALMLKEIMDRNNIQCEYAEGYTGPNNTGAHSWNIVTIDGKKYPIDLTWDNTAYRSGKSKSLDWFCKSPKEFAECHKPSSFEATQNYERTLSQINPQLPKKLYAKMGLQGTTDYRSTTFYGTRSDGSKFLVSQVGENRINNKTYYRYFYLDTTDNHSYPIIFYGDVNISSIVDKIKFMKPLPEGLVHAISDVMFSKENIALSLGRKTLYLGGVSKRGYFNTKKFVTSVQEIPKTEIECKLFKYRTKAYIRSDGSSFVAQKILSDSVTDKDIDVSRYDIFELVDDGEDFFVKRNTVYSEKDFFEDKRKIITDRYLSRKALDTLASSTGGYIGYIDSNSKWQFDDDLTEYFDTGKKINIDDFDEVKDEFHIPTIDELKSLVSEYTVVINEDESKPDIKIKNKQTGKIQMDSDIAKRALFANIWLTSAGVKYYQDEKIPGENYAFSEQANKLYTTIWKKMLYSCHTKGTIDTVDLFKTIDTNNDYEHNKQIVANLFSSPFQTQFINNYVLEALGKKPQGKIPQPLYNIEYASELEQNSIRNV